MITKLISGGQTGGDITALDVALRHGFPHGGWCLKGRKSLEGCIPAHYAHTETPPSSPATGFFNGFHPKANSCNSA